MKKTLFYLILLPLLLSAAGTGLRISFNGQAAKIPLKLQSSAGYFRTEKKIRNSDAAGRIDLTTPPVINGQWKKFTFTFTPELDGIISLGRFAAGKIVPGIAQWVEFRNFQVSGAEHVLALRSKVNKSPAGLDRMSNRAPLCDDIKVRKGHPVTVEFEARTAAAEPEKNYNRRDWMFQPQKYTVGWQDKRIKLLAGSDRGASFTHYGSGYHAKSGTSVFDRPAAEHVPDCSFSVPVELLEEDGISGKRRIRFGFPLPEKSFFNVKNLAVFDAGNKAVPAHVYATGYWSDRSIKWALFEFETMLKAGEKSLFYIRGGKAVKAHPAGIPELVTDGRKYRISAEKISAVIDPDSDALLKNIVCGGKNFGDLKLIANQNAAGRISSVARESNTVWRLNGELTSNRYLGSFTVRLDFASASPVLRVVVTSHANNLEREINELDSLQLILTSGPGKLASGGVFQGNDLCHSINGKVKKGFMPESDFFTAAPGKIAFALTDAGKRYPKSFSHTGSGLEIGLLPPQPDKNFNSDLPGYLRFPYMDGKYRLMAGMNFTEEITFDFSGRAVSSREVIAVIPASWYARTNALRGVFPDATTKAFDKQALHAFHEHLERKIHQREYGFLNWGDWFGERGGCNWGNNEYDLAYGLLMLFVRTGNRDVYRLGMQAARHQSDVDIIHATPFQKLLGGNYMHSVGHTGRRAESYSRPAPWYTGADCQGYANPINGHSWTGGLFTAFLLSGKSDIGDSARLLAACMVANSNTPLTEPGNPRSHGWLLEGLMQAFDATGDQSYLKAGKTVADTLFKAQNLEMGGVWVSNLHPSYLRNGIKSGIGASCFQMGVVIQALHHYAQYDQRQEIRKNLSAAAQWMRKTYIPAAVSWPYVALWNNTALWRPFPSLNMLMLAAAAADGAAESREILCDGLQMAVLRGIPAGGDGKDLAMNLLLVPAIFDILKSLPGEKEFSFQKFINRFSKLPHLMRLRGPEQMKLDITLKNPGTTLCFERNFYNRRKGKLSRYKVQVKDPHGKTVYSFEGNVNDERDVKKSCVLNGKKGDMFTIFIEDNMSSYWEVYSLCRTPVRVHLVRGSQLSNGVPLFFTLKVPSGGRDFTIRYTGCHPGPYGIAAMDSSGRILTVKSDIGTTLQLPWLKGQKAETSCDIKIRRTNISQEETYHFFTWSAGDILLNAEGCKPVVEFCR